MEEKLPSWIFQVGYCRRLDVSSFLLAHQILQKDEVLQSMAALAKAAGGVGALHRGTAGEGLPGLCTTQMLGVSWFFRFLCFSDGFSMARRLSPKKQLRLGKLFGGVRSLSLGHGSFNLCHSAPDLRSQVSFEKTFVSLAEIFTAGVLMSEIISSTNKLHFAPRKMRAVPGSCQLPNGNR